MSIVVTPTADDYTPLLARVADWMFRPDLTTKIPTFISLAEAEIFRELNLRQTETVQTGTTTTNTIQIPSGGSIERLIVNVDSVEYTLDYTSPNGIEALTFSSGRPSRFTVENQAIRLLKAPASAYSYSLYYIPNLSPLAPGNTSNWLSSNSPDLYLYGALVQAARYTMDDGQSQRFTPLYERALDSVRREDEARRFPLAGGLQIKPRHAR